MKIIDILLIFDDIWREKLQKNHVNQKKTGKNSTYVYKNLSDEPKTILNFLVCQTIWEQKNTQNIPIYETPIHQKSMFLR